MGEAEQYLAAAAAVDPADERNLSALAYVRAQRGASGQGNGGVVSADAPDSGDPARTLFADLSAEGAGIVILIDAVGLVLAGESVTHDGRDVAAEVGAAMSGIGEEAGRAMRHLGLGAWTSVVFETDRASVALAPAPGDGLVLLAASRTTPLGFVRRMLARALATSHAFLAGAT